MRGVIEPGGQMVNASDRLYLAAHVPTLIVWGDHDGIIPVAHAHAAHELIPTSRLEIMEGVGHFPHVEAPERFCEVLLDFLATTSPGSTDDESCARSCCRAAESGSGASPHHDRRDARALGGVQELHVVAGERRREFSLQGMEPPARLRQPDHRQGTDDGDPARGEAFDDGGVQPLVTVSLAHDHVRARPPFGEAIVEVDHPGIDVIGQTGHVRRGPDPLDRDR